MRLGAHRHTFHYNDICVTTSASGIYDEEPRLQSYVLAIARDHDTFVLEKKYWGRRDIAPDEIPLG
jgi:hypothetical protein